MTDKQKELLAKYSRVANDKSQLEMFVQDLILGEIDSVASTTYVDTAIETAITGKINADY